MLFRRSSFAYRILLLLAAPAAHAQPVEPPADQQLDSLCRRVNSTTNLDAIDYALGQPRPRHVADASTPYDPIRTRERVQELRAAIELSDARLQGFDFIVDYTRYWDQREREGERFSMLLPKWVAEEWATGKPSPAAERRHDQAFFRDLRQRCAPKIG